MPKVKLDELFAPLGYIEDVAPRFAAFLTYAWQKSAENFAADLAKHGADPTWLRTMADRWRNCDFDPPAYADALDNFADWLESD